MHKNMCRFIVFSACAVSFGLIAMDQDGKGLASQDSPRKLRSSSLASPRAMVSSRLNRSGSLSAVGQAAVAKTMKKTASLGTLGNLKLSEALRLSDKSKKLEDTDEELFKLINLSDKSDRPEVTEALLELSYGGDLDLESTPAEKAKVVENLHAITRLRSSTSPRERGEATLAKEKTAEGAQEDASRESTEWTRWQAHGDAWDFE